METIKRAIQSKVEIRKEPDGGKSMLTGKILVNQRSVDLGGYFEEILPGAFDPIMDNDVRGLKNHDDNLVLGRTKAGTMRMAIDEAGNLGYEIDLPNTTYARDLAESVERGDIDGTSFQFTLLPDGREWKENADGTIIRQIKKFARMIDISPVTFPAYPGNVVEARSEFEEFKKSKHPEEESTINLNRCKRRLRLIEIDN